MKHNKQPTPQTDAPIQQEGYTPGEMYINCPIDDDGKDIIKTNPQYGNQEYFVLAIKNSFNLVGFFYPHSKQSHETMKANAARIVECWNNYEGLKSDNEKLYERVSSFHKAVSRYKNEINSIKIANEKLKADVQELVQVMDQLYEEIDSQLLNYKFSEVIGNVKELISKHQ